jgi:hypothetical protein
LTDRKLIDEAKRLLQLFEKAPGFMAIGSGPEHVFEMVNASYQRLVGERQLIGKTVREAFPDLEGQGFFEILDHVYASGEAITGRARPIRLRRGAWSGSGRAAAGFRVPADHRLRRRSDWHLRSGSRRYRASSD